MNKDKKNIIPGIIEGEYRYGFTTDIDMEYFPKGINRNIIKKISQIKNEPEFMLKFRENAFIRWEKMKEPRWAHLRIPEIKFQDIIYYAAPKKKTTSLSAEEVSSELLETFERLGIQLNEKKCYQALPLMLFLTVCLLKQL